MLAAAAVSPPRVPRPPWGDAGPLSLRLASIHPWAGGGGGEGGVPWSPDAAPRRPRGGGLVVLALGGQRSTGGAHSSPAPLYPLRAGPSCRPSLRPPAPLAVAARRRLAGGGGGGGGPVSAGGGGSGQRSAVSGLRGSGPPLALGAPVPHPTGGGARPPVALYRGGGVGRGARLRRGGAVPRHCPPPTLSRPSSWPTGRGRHLCRLLCGGWGCGGGGFRRR